MAACELVCTRGGGWSALALRYTTRSLICFWRRKLILPSACVSPPPPPDTRLCTSEKGGGWAVGWGSEAENFPLVVSPTELLARLESDAAWRHGSHLGSKPPVNISTQARLQGDGWTCCFHSVLLSTLWTPTHPSVKFTPSLRTNLIFGILKKHFKLFLLNFFTIVMSFSGIK